MRHFYVSAFCCVSLLCAACAAPEPEEELGSVAAELGSSACPASVPAKLAPDADQDLAFVLGASGVQKYVCAANPAGVFTWTFVAPEADLFSRCGGLVGSHYAGPTWEYQDGSSVIGARVDGATVDPSAIPWLLLRIVSHGGPIGLMTKVTAIQRLSTSGGLAPATGCDADHAGATADVPYTADYFFYRTRTHHMEHNLRCGAQ